MEEEGQGIVLFIKRKFYRRKHHGKCGGKPRRHDEENHEKDRCDNGLTMRLFHHHQSFSLNLMSS
ncbi:MAG: HNH endonuclease [Clostridia bacterium]|nr:HNH endonuclease [Clostridia bacterium]